MATTTPNYGWPVPTSTDYVKDGALAIENLGDAIDTTVFGFKTGLKLISATTIGSAVSSVTLTGVFSATYDNYKIMIAGGAGTIGGVDPPFFSLVFGSTTTGYYEVRPRYSLAGSASLFTTNNGSSFIVGGASTSGLNANIEVQSPFLSKNTLHNSNLVGTTTNNLDLSYGYLANTTSYTACTLAVTSGTMTAGTIRVYGYVNS